MEIRDNVKEGLKFSDSASHDVPQSPPLPMELQHDSSFTDIRHRLQGCLGLPEDRELIIKLRRGDGTLLPLSYLLAGSSETE
jgi:hypothetical protein